MAEGPLQLVDMLSAIDGYTAKQVVYAMVATLEWLSSGTYTATVIPDGMWYDQLAYYADELFYFATTQPHVKRASQVIHPLRVYLKKPTLKTAYNQ